MSFHQDQTVTLEMDCDALMQKARRYEYDYGEDKGHGWLLRHPIMKLKLFKEYVQQKRHEKSQSRSYLLIVLLTMYWVFFCTFKPVCNGGYSVLLVVPQLDGETNCKKDKCCEL